MSDWTPELAKEIRERCEAATPGPWERTPNDGIKAWLEPPRDVPGHHRIVEAMCWQDSEFVAHARTDLPTALDRVEALELEVERANSFLADLVEMADMKSSYNEKDLRKGIARAFRGVSPFAGEHGR